MHVLLVSECHYGDGCHDNNYMATAAAIMTTVAWQQTQMLMHMARFTDQYDHA